MRTKAAFLIVLGLLVLATTSAFADFTVYVGYADSLRPSGFFPNPWNGSPGVTFIGNTDPGLDTGAIRIDNTGLTSIVINDISYHQSSGPTYDLWGTSYPITILAGHTLIVSSTANYNFDSSDTNGHWVYSQHGRLRFC